MPTFRDDRYGEKGHVIWLLAAGPPVFGGIAAGFVWAILEIDFEGATDAFIALLAVLAFCVWLLLSTIYVVATGPSIAQHFYVAENDDQMSARLYFGRELSFSTSDVASFDEVATNRYIPLPTLLNPKGSNYRLRLNSGRQILIPGHLPGAREVANHLRSHIQRGTRRG